MKRLLALIAATVALFGAATEAQAGTPVRLKDQLVDADGRVTLGDLFEGAGQAAGVLLANGPAAGGSIVLDAAAVQVVARRYGLDWSNDHGFRRLVVKNDGSAVSAGAPGAMVDVLTYSRSIATGEIVQPEDVVWTKVQAHLAPADAAGNAEDVIGQAARRPLRQGAPVASHDLSKPMVVKKGDLISVTYNMDGVSLSLQAQAAQAGAVGDPISVLNPQSKKTIVAVVTGPGTAAVGPEADSLRSSTRLATR
jgi:flagella basal body P-ring formation protein FlgA